MNEEDIVTYSEIRNLKNEKDVLERILIEKTQKCDEIGRKYYNQQKEQILETIKYNSNKSNDINYKQRVINLKKAQRDLERLCSQFGHDAPMPPTPESKVRCRCCGDEFSYDELIISYFRRTLFSKMIIFDYIKKDQYPETPYFSDK